MLASKDLLLILSFGLLISPLGLVAYDIHLAMQLNRLLAAQTRSARVPHYLSTPPLWRIVKRG